MLDKTVKIGDLVKCIKEVHFCNGEKHRYGQIILIDSINIYYYNHIINTDNYELVKGVDK